jgi:3-oxoadipate enol-lactonase
VDEPTRHSAPPLPPGRRIGLGRRGTTFVRECGPLDGPPVVLLHGWTATADLNFVVCYGPLARAGYRVIALDHRGHGQGIRSRRPFRLADCADDVAALADELDLGSFVPVGYSMGGPVAQLVWRRHPERVRGLVLCATAARFASSVQQQLPFLLGFGGLAGLSRLTPSALRRYAAEQIVLSRRRNQGYQDWALDQVTHHDWTAVLEAGVDLGRFSSVPWIGEVDVPTSIVLTEHDPVVSPRRQQALADRIPGATVQRVQADHAAAVLGADRFVPALLAALRDVHQRAASADSTARAAATTSRP